MATPRSIHEFTAATIDDSTLVLVDVPDEGAESGYITGQCSTTNLGNLIVNDIEFTQDLQTTAKTIVGAINEAAAGGAVEVTGTLTAGQTSLTLSNAAITANATYDYYTDKYGVNPSSVTISNGSMTLTFEAQSSNLGVKVRIS